LILLAFLSTNLPQAEQGFVNLFSCADALQGCEQYLALFFAYLLTAYSLPQYWQVTVIAEVGLFQ